MNAHGLSPADNESADHHRKLKPQARVRRSAWLQAFRAFSRDRGSVIALIFLLIVALAAVLAPYISPHDPYEAVATRNTPPLTEGLLLGADDDGRDVLTRLLWGGRVSLLIG